VHKHIVTVSDDDIESLKHRNCELLEQQRESEAAFAQQRAKFMELFRQKEGCKYEVFLCKMSVVIAGCEIACSSLMHVTCVTNY